jgi:hypothetical protein
MPLHTCPDEFAAANPPALEHTVAHELTLEEVAQNWAGEGVDGEPETAMNRMSSESLIVKHSLRPVTASVSPEDFAAATWAAMARP